MSSGWEGEHHQWGGLIELQWGDEVTDPDFTWGEVRGPRAGNCKTIQDHHRNAPPTTATHHHHPPHPRHRATITSHHHHLHHATSTNQDKTHSPATSLALRRHCSPGHTGLEYLWPWSPKHAIYSKYFVRSYLKNDVLWRCSHVEVDRIDNNGFSE